MRIKKLELIGFKSFKDRTVIQFDKGITGVVGPNGCGKSNIVDALTWVMGEMSAKQLRGSSMEDVIFAGSEGHAPVGMAEVSMTLENDGGPFPVKYLNHSEIMVTRRLHRSGESGYYINKEPARLRDVQEIFMDTGAGSKGFSIIAQGMISQIILQKPEERRSLIEEAAGITKFKARKKESQRKLVATEQNLVRLNDIITELKRQIDSLQRQAQRAERYRKLKGQIEDLDLWLSSKEYVSLRERVEELEKELHENSDSESAGEVQTADLEARVEALRTDLGQLENTIQERQQVIVEMQENSRNTDMRIRELAIEIDQTQKMGERTGTLLQEFKTRAEIQEIEANEASEKLAAIEHESATIESEFNEKSELYTSRQSQIEGTQEILTEKRREMLTLSSSVSATTSKIQVLEQQKVELLEKQERENQVLREVADKRTDYEKRRNRMRDDVEKSRQLHLEMSQDVESFDANRQSLIEQVAEKRQEQERFRGELNQVVSKLESLEELHSNLEGFNEGVKKAVNWYRKQVETHADGSQSEYFQPVAEVVEVDPAYEVAMESALGARMQTLLTENHDSSLGAVDYLKESGGGRSSFLSMRDAGSSSMDSRPSGEGLLTVLEDEIKMPEQFESSAKSLFRNIAVVDSVRTALKFRADHGDWTFVTKEGDVLSTDGVLSGGSIGAGESGYLKRKREIKELTDRKAEWSGKLALTTALLEKLEKQLENLTQDYEDAQKRNLEQEIKLAETRKDLERADHEYENSNRAFEQQQSRVSQADADVARLEEQVESLSESLAEQKEQRMAIERIIEDLDRELNEHNSSVEGLQQEVTELKVRVNTMNESLAERRRQNENAQAGLRQTVEQIQRMEQESVEQSSSLSENEIEVEQKKVELEKMFDEIEHKQSELSEFKDRYEVQSSQLRDTDAELSELTKKKNEWQMKINELQFKIEKERDRQQHLIDQIGERYNLRLDEKCDEYAGRDGDEVEAKAELSDLKGKLSRIGEVNLSAITEYDETQDRYEFLKKQQEDLIAAKNQLGRVIERINKICTSRFQMTFDQVNDRFKKVFPVLFGGGEAELRIVVQEGKEDGIDIIAKPPGKKMQNVTLMSGGEKALTAVSLIFSIFLVKPSPYCLLDEVDAPLDDANVARFNELVNEMSKRSQIILVTHNKYTMEITKKLYGVTMQEKGVSKMVSVSLDDARKVVEGA